MMKATALLLTLVSLCASSQAAYIRAEPDFYSDMQYMPDDIGVKLRTGDIQPGGTDFDASWTRIRARTYVGYPPFHIPTGSNVLGTNAVMYWNGSNYGPRAFFVAADNTPAPTRYIGFSIGWATVDGWSEGARIEVWGNTPGGSEVQLVNRVVKPERAMVSFGMFYSGITRTRVTCWNDSSKSWQKAFVFDDFRFVDTSGTDFKALGEAPIEAPDGMTLNADDSLSGNGTVSGDLTNGGAVNPGESPGVLIIDGNYQQTDQGELVFEIGGQDPGQFDVLSIVGQADLAGTLHVMFDGHVPSPGEEFLVMEYASHSGHFDSILLPQGTQAVPDYNAPGGLLLTFVPEPSTLALAALGLLGLRRRRRA